MPTNVVTEFAIDEKKLTFGNKHKPRRVYEMKTGRNSKKKNITFTNESLIS